MSDSSKRRIKCVLCKNRTTKWWSYFNNLMLFCESCKTELHSGSLPWDLSKKDVEDIKAKMLLQWMQGKRNTQGNV